METRSCACCRKEQPMIAYSSTGKAVIDTIGRSKAFMRVSLRLSNVLNDCGMDDEIAELEATLEEPAEINSTWRINYCPMCGKSLVDTKWGTHLDYRD